ncbi:SPOR domain-containing protein [Piscinibacter sakaiensis]|uniref:DedD protein n=1 Tax=Piscinibacter sakaiensis TaxID=1547922 RepID=A0A0K8P308_PISS1|nr:SPOR domain-containing protein [Piscinibacter sakaiensis]GAP36565.1 DedD protein [Piscinibacter sakaiensis]
MGLLSSFLLRPASSEGGGEADAPDDLARARTRARQRLIGAVVLVGIGVIAFPLLFETQPRPIPVDVAIDLPKREGAPPLAVPPAPARVAASPASSAGGRAAATPASSPNPAPARAPQDIITETAAEAGLKPARGAPAGEGAATAAARPEPRAEARSEARTEPRAEARVEPRADARPAAAEPARSKPAEPARPDDAARARALLEGRPTATASPPAAAPASAAAPRFIVQIGAFADPALAQQTRLKVERLGLTTYTHVAQTPDGARTRVRVGPVTTRQEAEKMAARIKAAGMPAAILTL